MNIFSEITWSSLLGTLLTNVPHFSGTAIKSFSFLSFCCFCKTFNLKKLSKKKKEGKVFLHYFVRICSNLMVFDFALLAKVGKTETFFFWLQHKNFPLYFGRLKRKPNKTKTTYHPQKSRFKFYLSSRNQRTDSLSLVLITRKSCIFFPSFCCS